MRKVITARIVFTVLGTNSFAPKCIFADTIKSPKEKNIVMENKVNLSAFSNFIRTLGIQIPSINNYGLVVLQQPNVEIKNMVSLLNQQNISKANII
ncbi:TPA: hypothetical protein ACLQU7_004818 [Bacillus tropicus]|uniref:hypothetical protein n=1 Tax=Bacillus cereus group TaxID=86661 RepID=UPI000540A28D|nr:MULTISPECIES: hypothetical protein [Bacillus cereus group]AIY72991.1 hemolytic enterotoxin family protein [Bacillus cereus]AJI07952.1 hemolytic enterotoxin family protein [Bacillus cereus G9241]QPS53445.1 hypothetical protein I6G54_28835 [Bacillus tropicus]